MILNALKLKFQEFKLIIIAILVIAIVSYIGYLNYQLISKDNEILKLQTTISMQNVAIESASKERTQLQTSLQNTADMNKSLISAVSWFKGEIGKRPAAKSCEEALTNITQTANTVAEKWNRK